MNQIKSNLIFWTLAGHNIHRKCSSTIHDQTFNIQVQEWNVPVRQVSWCIKFWMVMDKIYTQMVIKKGKLMFLNHLINPYLLQASLLHHFCPRRWLLERPYSSLGGLDKRAQTPICEGDMRRPAPFAKIGDSFSIPFPFSRSFSESKVMQVCEPPPENSKKGCLIRMETRAVKDEATRARWAASWSWYWYLSAITII